jgi:hypothetical protein
MKHWIQQEQTELTEKGKRFSVSSVTSGSGAATAAMAGEGERIHKNQCQFTRMIHLPCFQPSVLKKHQKQTTQPPSQT